MLFTKIKYVLFLLIVGLGSVAHAGVIGEGLLWGGDIGLGIYTIDPSSGVATKRLDVTGASRTINDLAFDRNSGFLYGISGGSLYNRPNTLFTIDLNSTALAVSLLGTVVPPDPGAASISGLTFVNGTLLASQWNGQLNAIFSIDTTNLSVSDVYYLPSPANFNIVDLASPYHAGIPVALQANSRLFDVALPTGPVSLLGNPSITGNQWGLAYAQDRNRFYSTGSDRMLWEIDPLTASPRAVATMQIQSGNIYGLEYVPFAAVPEPSSLVIWSLMGVCGFVSQRRRRLC